jgi:hypothetical protein
MLAMSQNYNAIPTFTAALASGDLLSNYKTLKYQVYGINTGNKQAELYAITNAGTVASPTSLGNTYSTTIGSNNLIGYISGYSVGTQGSWSSSTFDLTAASAPIATITGTSLNVGLGLNAPAGSVYLIDQVELVP